MLRRTLLAAAFAAPLAAQTLLPTPASPAGNPSTPAKVLLGKALFWDEQLSSSRSVACGTCHVFSHGGADPRASTSLHPGGDGVLGNADDVHGSAGLVRQRADGSLEAAAHFGLQPQVTRRRAPSVVNAAYARSLFVDGRASDVFFDPIQGAMVLPGDAALERQALEPPLNATEMSHLGRTWNDIAADLQGLTPLALATAVPPPLQQFVAGQTYGALFAQVYGTPGVTAQRLVFALAAYQRTLLSDQSPFDLYLAGQGTLTFQASLGLRRFQVLCAGCHTDLQPEVQQNGPVLDDYRNIGVRPPAEDLGRGAITQLAADRGRFRVPGLRNVALRAPYFHNGGMADLGAVIDFYARGGDDHDNQDALVANISGHITIADRLALVTLLQTLTDPRVAQELPPFDRPHLSSEGPAAPHAFGHGTAGGPAPPRSVVAGPAFLGNARFAIGVDRVPANASTLLLLDVAANASPVAWLGHDLYLAGTPVLCGLPTMTLGSAAEAYAFVPLPVPNAPALAGTPLFGQWLVLDGAAPAGFATSDALSLLLFR